MQTHCAQESVPQGGAKDEKGPELKQASPPNKSLHFSGTKIRIQFNEFLKETGFAQTLISPPLDKRPDYHIEGRTLTITLKSKLRDSTTYTINFADDIKDLNEGNTASNFTYVFSTGSYIDSQKIGGSVTMAKENMPADGIVVGIYPADSVDGILKSKPFYFAKTDKAGQFKIENMRAGKYWVYGLKDQNYNYIYDQPNELIAFSDTAVWLTDSTAPNVKLFLFEENKRGLRLEEVRTMQPGLLQIAYNKPVETFKLDWKGHSTDDFAWIYSTNDTIKYWYSKYYAQKDTFYLTANDTLKDTVRMELKFIPKDSVFYKKQYDLSIVNQLVKTKKDSLHNESSGLQELYKPLKIVFSRPIIEINKSKAAQIFEDSSTKPITPDFKPDEKSKEFALLEFEKKESSAYTLEIPDSMLRDVFGTWNKKLTYRFTTNGKSSYGNLRITLKTEHPEKYYIIKLMNASGEIVQEFFLSGNDEKKVTVENILAGSYRFLVIEDTNKNGKWDTGDLKRKRQPEKTYTYKATYTLKGGWDLDVEVKF